MVDQRKARRLMFAALLTAVISIGIFAAYQVVSARAGYFEARREYDALRQYAPSAPQPDPTRQEPARTPPQAASSDTEAKPEPVKNLPAINPDYIGWLRIEGAGVDYPVVRGADNERYLTTSFTGEPNDSGAIFMDAACAEGFAAPFVVIYGHNMDDGSMFSALNKYIDAEYLTANRELTVVTADGDPLSYSIIGASVTDVSDAAYALIGAEQKAVEEYMTEMTGSQKGARFLALSTCTNSGDDDERLLVFAVADQDN